MSSLTDGAGAKISAAYLLFGLRAISHQCGQADRLLEVLPDAAALGVEGPAKDLQGLERTAGNGVVFRLQGMPASGFSSELERSVAMFLEAQEQLFFWYRNRSRHDYFVQGWQPHRIYADFIFLRQRVATMMSRRLIVSSSWRRKANTSPA